MSSFWLKTWIQLGNRFRYKPRQVIGVSTKCCICVKFLSYLFTFLMYLLSGRLSTDGHQYFFFLKSDTFSIPTLKTLIDVALFLSPILYMSF